MERLRQGWELLQETGARWSEDQAARMSAALSYYTTFSLAPLLILVIYIAGLAFGRQAAEGHIVDQIASLVGLESAHAIQTMIRSAWKPTEGFWASIFS